MSLQLQKEMTLIYFCFLSSLQANKTKELLKNNNAGTDRASFRDAFADIREQRNADVQQILDEVIVGLF
jgi:hypothetical protein